MTWLVGGRQIRVKIAEWMRGSGHWAELAALVLMAIVVAVALRQPAVQQRFTIDESRWISTSRYFWISIVEWDVFGPAWQPNYLVLTQPPVARYLLGAGLWVQGWTPEQLNGRYDSLRDRGFNERAGNVPSAELLAAARRVVFVFAIGTVLVLYGIGRMLGGPTVGVVAVGLAIVNPLLSTLWTRALAESILAFFSLLTVLLALRDVVDPKRSLGWSLGTGATLGLAAATKLSGVLVGGGLALFALLGQTLARSEGRQPTFARRWIALGLMATLVFVAVNPLLYPDPIGRTVMLFQHRRDEMRQQQRTWPGQAVPDNLGSRVALVGRRVFEEFGSLTRRTKLPLDAVLVIGGLALASAGAWRDLVAKRALGPSGLVVCWAAFTYGGISANLGFDSSHYYAPLVTLNVLLEALAAGWLLRWLMGRIQAGRVPFSKRMIHVRSSAAATAHGNDREAYRTGPTVPRAESGG